MTSTNNISGDSGDTINIWQDGNTVYYENSRTDASGTIDFNQPGCNIINNTSNPTSYLIINFTSNINLNSSTQYFIIGSQYILIDGLNYTITITINTGDNYLGLVQNSTYGNITIQNIKVDGINSTLRTGGGWIGQSFFKYGNFTNCSSNGPIGISTNPGCGGIVGYGASNGSKVTATNCYSTGAISNQSGGIFGSNAGYIGIATATNCYSTGPISGGSGGIFGSDAGYSTASVIGIATATNCYSTGPISGGSGGIFGSDAGAGGGGGTATATNCYSTGAISGESGGIFGSGAGADAGTTTATSCMYNGTFDPTNTTTYGQLAGSKSQNITPTNIVGFINKI